MDRGVLIPSARVRRLLRLVGEAGELVRSATDPQPHLAAGLLELIGGDFGGLAAIPRDAVPGTNAGRMVVKGWSDAMRKEATTLYLKQHGTALNPVVAMQIARARVGAPAIGSRRRFLADRD